MPARSRAALDKPVETSAIARRRHNAQAAGGDGYTARRAEIVKAAVLVFREKGYEATTLNDIAAKLNTDRASLYYYTSGKEELLGIAMQRIILDNAEQCRQVAALNEPASRKVELFIEKLVSSFEQHYPHMYVFIQEDLNRAIRQDTDLARVMIDVSREVENLFLGILEEGVNAGEFRRDVPTQLVANAMFGMVNWTHRWFKPDRHYTAAEVAAYFSTILLDGSRRQ